MLRKIAKLIDVKSLVTLTLTVDFSVLALRRDLTAGQVLKVFLLVISFYFGTQYEKTRGDKE